ncbi:hypothetical protein GGR50DRAFT_128551 [Xylaria sp. CBS 124048]|nr:hypothetical protein GGR50DRAFT_128551 [Xylaria sp. CBS 124048]
MMGDPRPRHAGRRSPIVNPARASMPVNIGYNLPYTGELHAAPTARYDASVPRRLEPKAAPSPNPPPAAAVTTYNVTADPMSRSQSRSNRNRSLTVDSHAAKPIIVTTNHPRPHPNPTHTPNSARAGSPAREPFRPADDAYYSVQPASSIRSRSHNRHNYNQGAPLGDEFYRLRERVGGAVDDRFWAPSRTTTDNFRNPRPHVLYTTPAHPAVPAHHPTPAYGNSGAVIDYDDDYYEYTKPGELLRYDLDHDRERRSRRDSVDRPYYRPHVNVISHDTTRYEPRNRAKPPPSAGLERYNRAAAAGAYDRPSVTMPAPPAVPPPPPIDSTRRPPALLEDSRSPSSERRNVRPRPVSLYQDGPVRPPPTEDPYRSRDDERVGKDRRERDDNYRDENVTARGFGIRTNTLDQQTAGLQSGLPASNYDERRPRRDTGDRDSKRTSDESLTHVRPFDRDTDGSQSRIEESRDRKNGISRRESISRTRDRPIAGGKAAAAIAAGLVSVIGRYDGKVSPRREAMDEENDYRSRVAPAGQSREREASERALSPRAESIASEQRQEPRKESAGPNFGPEGQAAEDMKDQNVHAEVNADTTAGERDASPETASNQGRRRQRPAPAFDPMDTKDLMDLKVELDAADNQSKATETAEGLDTASARETASVYDDMSGAYVSDKEDDSVNDSRGREIVPMREEKQVRLVSPPRDTSEQKPIKGILKAPRARFPEDANPIREGVAPHKDDQTKKDVPPGARWTKISRKKVNPEALTIGKERFEVRDDFVIVLRVLNKEEIQAYATATAQLREKRRKEFEREAKEAKGGRNSDEEQTRSDEERQRRQRHRQEREDDETRGGRVPDDKQRRHKHDDDSESRRKTIEYH